MSVISDIEGPVLDRLEENRAAPQFWNLQGEIRPLILEAMCEATLLSGEPEVKAGQVFTIVHNQTLQVMPAGAFAILRVELDGLPIRKVSVFDLDMNNTQWQLDPAASTPSEWFPFGLTAWGIHPQVKADVQCVLTVVQFPVTSSPPYTGAEVIPFQSEFNLGLEEYANCWARLKEGSAELDAGMSSYELFLSVMEELSNFALRKGSLRFSKVVGSAAELTPIQKK